MPISAHPNVRTPFLLRKWEEIPAVERPAFLVRFLTEAQRQEHRRLMQEAYESPDNAACTRLLWQAAQLGITGWRNVTGDDGKPLEFNAVNFFCQLTDPEIWEVCIGYPSAVLLSKRDLRHFESAAPSAGAQPAPVAAAESARTNQP